MQGRVLSREIMLQCAVVVWSQSSRPHGLINWKQDVCD